MGHNHELIDDLREPSRQLRSHIPDVYKGFADVAKSAMADGALNRKTKELIAVAISVAKQCDGCIAKHAKGAVAAGATEQEFAEMLGVSIQMGGGPATTYAARAFAAYQEFANQ